LTALSSLLLKNNNGKRQTEHYDILLPPLEQRVIEKDSDFDGQNTWFDDANWRPSSDKYTSSLTSVIYAFKMLIQYRAEHELWHAQWLLFSLSYVGTDFTKC